MKSRNNYVEHRKWKFYSCLKSWLIINEKFSNKHYQMQINSQQLFRVFIIYIYRVYQKIEPAKYLEKHTLEYYYMHSLLSRKYYLVHYLMYEIFLNWFLFEFCVLGLVKFCLFLIIFSCFSIFCFERNLVKAFFRVLYIFIIKRNVIKIKISAISVWMIRYFFELFF